MRLRATLDQAQLGDAAVDRFMVREAMSENFDARVELTTPSPDVDLAALLDTATVLTLSDAESGTDAFLLHGMIEEAEVLEPVRDGFRFRLRLRPRLSALAYRVRSRLFQEKTAVAIVEEVLKGAGFPDNAASFRLSRNYPKRELCVQYRETELNFILRLLEDEGICFWFEHSGSGHVLVLADDAKTPGHIAGDAVVRYSRWLQRDVECVSDLVFSSAIGPDLHVTRDWNWERPTGPIEAEQRLDSDQGRVWYEYPGGFCDAADGGRRAKDRLEAIDRTRVLEGASTCRRLRAGRRFECSGAFPSFLDTEWLLVSVDHSYDATPGAGEHEGSYTARFSAIPADLAFRPLRRTPKPRVRGKELAVITGPGGEDIHVDKMGRVKIHFLWDREGAVDDKSSTWVRVQQLNTSGSMILPRVGWEVDVGFVDGDPDRPVVLQKLYNRDNLPPHGLPDAKTKTSLQSHTAQGGEGVNALHFEDGSGGMECALVASRNLDIVTGHDATETIGTDCSHEVGLNLRTLVGGSEETIIGAGQCTSIGGACTLETAGDKSISVGGLDQRKVKDNDTFTCDGSGSERIGALANLLASRVTQTVNGSSTRKIGAALSFNAVKAIVEVVGGSKTETTGGARLEILRGAHCESASGSKALTAAAIVEKAGKDIALAAKGSMAITVAGAMAVKAGKSFSLTGDSVKIVAASATLEAAGSKLEAGGSLKVNASSMASAGDAELKLKGKIDFKE
ncbi:MAG: type VI secretion system Vgr family protein [Myxococcales bacterium]